jgi:ribosomal protein L40E
MEKDFVVFEQEFQNLKKQFKAREISEQEFKKRLKAFQLEDNDGRCWTIGAQTGKWYYFDGKDWIPAQPPSLQQKKAICIYCGFENDLETEICTKCGGNIEENKDICRECGEKIDPFSGRCEKCEEAEKRSLSGNFLIHTVSPLSLFAFFGGLGFVGGIVIGAFSGVSADPSILTAGLPAFLRNLHGGLMGGIVYSLVGAVSGFVVSGIVGYITGLLVNLVLSVSGGLKIKLEKGED